MLCQVGYGFVDVYSLSVSWQDYAKVIHPIFTKFAGKSAHGQRKKPLDFGGKGNGWD